MLPCGNVGRQSVPHGPTAESESACCQASRCTLRWRASSLHPMRSGRALSDDAARFAINARHATSLGRWLSPDNFRVLANRLFITQIAYCSTRPLNNSFFWRAPHLHKLQWSDAVKWPTHRTVVGNHRLGLLPFRDSIAHHALHRRQLNLACAMQLQQQSATHHIAQRAVGLLPLPETSHTFNAAIVSTGALTPDAFESGFG